MAVAWIDAGGHWGRSQYLRFRLAQLGYEVEQWGAGWTDTETGGMAVVLDLTGGGRIKRALSTDRWPDRDDADF